MGLQTFLTESDITSLTDAQAETAALATYNLPVDHNPYDYSWIGIQIRAYMSIGWLPSMTMPILGGMVELVRGISYDNVQVGLTLDAMLSNKGYDFGDAANRYLVTTWMPQAPPEATTLLNAFLFVGAPTCPRWQAPQYAIYIDNLTNPTIISSTAPTQADITAMRSTMAGATSQFALLGQFATLVNETIQPQITDGTLKTKSDIKTAIAGW